jgi:hypothetical protein
LNEAEKWKERIIESDAMSSNFDLDKEERLKELACKEENEFRFGHADFELQVG